MDSINNCNQNSIDENDLMSYTIFSTPKKNKTPKKEIVTPTARKSAQQSQIDRAYSAQVETNNLLKQLVQENIQIKEKLIELISLHKL